MARKTLLCNDLLVLINKACAEHPNSSFKSISKQVGVKEATLSAWNRNFKTNKWPADYGNTADGNPLSPEVVRAFVDHFKSVGLKGAILKRLLNSKCLKDSSCFSRQYGVLESLLKTYPDLNFWLYADFGGTVDELLFLRGKNEPRLRKKYRDFNRNIEFFDLQFKEECVNPLSSAPPPPLTAWDFYEQ